MSTESPEFQSVESTSVGATYTAGGEWPGAGAPTVDQQAKIDAALQDMNVADTRSQVVATTDVSEAAAPNIGYTKSVEQIGQDLQNQGVTMDSGYSDK
jgi:hypothetical protein